MKLRNLEYYVYESVMHDHLLHKRVLNAKRIGRFSPAPNKMLVSLRSKNLELFPFILCA